MLAQPRSAAHASRLPAPGTPRDRGPAGRTRGSAPPPHGERRSRPRGTSPLLPSSPGQLQPQAPGSASTSCESQGSRGRPRALAAQLWLRALRPSNTDKSFLPSPRQAQGRRPRGTQEDKRGFPLCCIPAPSPAAAALVHPGPAEQSQPLRHQEGHEEADEGEGAAAPHGRILPHAPQHVRSRIICAMGREEL